MRKDSGESIREGCAVISAERAAMRALEAMQRKPELLESCARQVFLARFGHQFGVKWESLDEQKRQEWRDHALATQREFAGLPRELQDAVNAASLAETIRHNDGDL